MTKKENKGIRKMFSFIGKISREKNKKTDICIYSNVQANLIVKKYNSHQFQIIEENKLPIIISLSFLATSMA